MQHVLEIEQGKCNSMPLSGDNRAVAFQSGASSASIDAAHAEYILQIEDAVDNAKDAVSAKGIMVDQDMIALATDIVGRFSMMRFDAQTMQEQAHWCFLVEAAIRAAVAGATEKGETVTQPQINHARCSASSVTSLDYQLMEASAQRALLGRDMFYVIMVNGCTKMGTDLILSLGTLGDCFDMRVRSGTLVRDVAIEIAEDRQLRCPLGFKVQVKLVDCAGTLLDENGSFHDPEDYETDVVEETRESCEYYPLSVLTGQAWRELCLDGPTRWKYLPENEFMGLFGMNKISFAQLKPWMQASMRKKHGLF